MCFKDQVHCNTVSVPCAESPCVGSWGAYKCIGGLIKGRLTRAPNPRVALEGENNLRPEQALVLASVS